MKITPQESQIIHIIRGWDNQDAFRLVVEREDGTWKLTLSKEPHDLRHTSRGTGATFGDAWDNLRSLWA